jgi:putative transcriptional regulator
MIDLQGRLLIASPRMMDPNFIRSVIYMVTHDEEGSMGLILNRPLDISLEEALATGFIDDITATGILYQGGPCDSPLMALHDDETHSQIAVKDGIHFSIGREDVAAVLREPGKIRRFFAGYAGWTAGQLQQEIDIGSWLYTTAAVEQIFSDSLRQWQNWVTILTGDLKIAPDSLPDDPLLN